MKTQKKEAKNKKNRNYKKLQDKILKQKMARI